MLTFYLTFQEQVTARDPPSEYLNKLKIYLDPNKDKMSKNLKTLGNNTSTQVLRDLVSLFIFLNDCCLFRNSILISRNFFFNFRKFPYVQIILNGSENSCHLNVMD